MLRTLLISLCLTSTAFATTWTVDDDGKADFDNIQAAVDASSDGDMIFVYPGTYTSTADEVVNMLGKAVTLRSLYPNNPDIVAKTIIDGEGARRGIVCGSGETSKTIIEGLTITNGYSAGSGGGMHNYNSDSTVTNCTFTGNIAYENSDGSGGGGMYNYYGNPTLTGCSFTSNTANSGGGMYNYYGNPSLSDCSFTSNNADALGGGMYSTDTSRPTLTDCTFTNNTANNGGGMYNFSNTPTVTGCLFVNNNAGTSGGWDVQLCYKQPDIDRMYVQKEQRWFRRWRDA